MNWHYAKKFFIFVFWDNNETSGIFQIKTESKNISFELFEYSVFSIFFYLHARQIALKSNEKAKKKLYPLIRLIKLRKLQIPLAPRWPNRNEKNKFIGFVQ